MDIYAAGEAPIPGVTRRDLAEGIRAHGHRDVLYLGGDRAAHRRLPVRDQPARAISCSRWAPATWASWAPDFCAGSTPDAAE